ncbi:MAG: hypothetical protein EB072_20850 [Betaproteobacteria bacterium]|jgi:uncharacterized protein (DUF4415 family)|nr:hypothetical protein [Betaproteobacteria bacterium]
MTNRLPLTDAEGEVRELTEADLALFRPAKEVLPPHVYEGLIEMNRRAGVRGPQKAPTKTRVSIRLSPEVVSAFKAGGRGWQSRIDAALKEWLTTHP